MTVTLVDTVGDDSERPWSSLLNVGHVEKGYGSKDVSDEGLRNLSGTESLTQSLGGPKYPGR